MRDRRLQEDSATDFETSVSEDFPGAQATPNNLNP